MRKYAKGDVMLALRGMIAKSSQSKVAAGLGYTPQYLSQVLMGKKALTADLALRVGYIQLPHAYVRAPKGKVK
jgi:plasmid maintenance system antidote protein VapI